MHAALTDWQRFGSAAGVGLSNFRHKRPWRPPSLLLEADPPRHDAPRAVLTRVLGPRTLHRLRAAWMRDAADLVDPSGHVGFGAGIHQCVGQHIARLEAEALLTALLARVESIELDGTPRRHLNNTLRSWESLPVRVVPHPAGSAPIPR